VAEQSLAIPQEGELGTIERVIAAGDLSKMDPGARARYYVEVCRSVGLNPLTQPFQYIVLNGRLTLYATRTATDQLRALHRVSIEITGREVVGELYVVTTRARLPDGRTDEEIGAVPVKGLTGDALANAWMKAQTKAKRRVTLAIVGLGWLDESELETIQGARLVPLAEVQTDLEPPPAPVLEPVTERTRILCAGFVDAVQAANPKVKPRLPPEDAGDAAWLRWLEQKSDEWRASPHNPAAVVAAAS
jgi:hypothetical protein